MTTLAPRTASPGQRLSYADAEGTLHRLEAEEIEEGRWVIQPQTPVDEAALDRHRMPIDEELAARQAAEEADAEKLVGDELDARARELEIEGRSTMNADQKRAAIAAAEEEAAAATDDAPGTDGSGEGSEAAALAYANSRAVDETTDNSDAAPSQEG